ncbi:MAG: PIN domain-containing protein [Proteobacteria bacterium]|nr:PIN domain-containing protein [Pseudomonadota bacterium]
MGYLLDTSALSALTQTTHPFHAPMQGVVANIPSGSAMFASVVALAEMEFGLNQIIANGANPTHIAEVAARLAIVRQYTRLDITHHTATSYAELKSKLAQSVQPRANRQGLRRFVEEWQDANTGCRLQIDENDLWIAAQAKERDLVIITGDPDFRKLELIDSDVHAIYICP